MHRRMVMTAVMLAWALLSLPTGCAGRTKGEDLVCLTDETPEEIPEDEERNNSPKILEEHNEDSMKDAKDKLKEGSKEDVGSDCKQGVIYVHVCGEVANPAVYPLPAGSRLYEAIQAAGGILESGAGEQLNQAAQLEDGQQVYVPSRDEVQEGLEGGFHSGRLGEPGSGNGGQQGVLSADEGKVNLNTASKEQLMTLSGIGEAKAASIIAYREEHGGFQKIEELMEVEGIKEGVFNKVRNQIRVN